MAEGTLTRRSIHEDNKKLGEKSQRRHSVFEDPHLTIEEKESTEAQLEEWIQRWGKYGSDYVNVVKYPEDYVQKIKEEREMWLEGLDSIKRKVQSKISDEAELNVIIKEDILTTEQRAFLRDTDSKINKYVEKATNFLRDFEVYKRMQEVKLEKIERDGEMLEMMVMAKNSCDN